MFQNNFCHIDWQDNQLLLLDQRQLPQAQITLSFSQSAEVAKAIQEMVVRGAPAIGITAAYAVVLAARAAYQQTANDWKTVIKSDLQILAQARPTAVNLIWSLERMQSRFADIQSDPEPILLAEAKAIHQEDIAANYKMGELGARLLPENCRVLTHCNAGALATGGYGTALGVIRSAYAAGKIKQVYADETRPWLQGVRLTAWELLQDKIPVTVQADGAAAYLMQQGKIDWVIVGSDRITANGDVANKIGTYSLAVLARHHGIKLMVVAPTSTIDMNLSSGEQINIEQRSPDEILIMAGNRIAPIEAQAWNPSFDVTPAHLVDVIVTEKGVIKQPSYQQIQKLMS